MTGPPRRRNGYTLVELLLVQLLGLLMIGVLLRLLPAGLSLRESASAAAMVQENQRLALETLDHLVAQAGFAGCHGGRSHVSVVDTADPRVSPRLAAWAYRRFRLFGRDADDIGAIDAVMGPGWGRSRFHYQGRAIGDLLWLQSVENAQMLVTDHDPDGESLSVSPLDPLSIEPGSVLRASDCHHSATFQVSDLAVDRSPDPANVRIGYQRAGAVNCAAVGDRVLLGGIGSPTCAPGNGGRFGQYRFPAGSRVMPLRSTLLYIGRHGGTGEPGLYLLELAADGTRIHSEAVVEGVENMRIRYGVDEDGDDLVDHWFTAAEIESLDPGWDAVDAVRIWLMLRATDHRGTTRFRQPVRFPARDGAMVNCGGDNAHVTACPFDVTENDDSGFMRRVVQTVIMLRNPPE